MSTIYIQTAVPRTCTRYTILKGRCCTLNAALLSLTFVVFQSSIFPAHTQAPSRNFSITGANQGCSARAQQAWSPSDNTHNHRSLDKRRRCSCPLAATSTPVQGEQREEAEPNLERWRERSSSGRPVRHRDGRRRRISRLWGGKNGKMSSSLGPDEISGDHRRINGGAGVQGRARRGDLPTPIEGISLKCTRAVVCLGSSDVS